MGFKGIFWAIQAGIFAALASVCAKLATSSSSAIYVSDMGTAFFETVVDLPISLPLTQVSTILRVIGVAGMFACNALMWVLFTKSMHLCHSTLEATAFNTASNFFFTAFLGFFLFGEQIATQWYLGSFLMVIGLAILHKSSLQDTQVVDIQEETCTPGLEGDESQSDDGILSKKEKKCS